MSLLSIELYRERIRDAARSRGRPDVAQARAHTGPGVAKGAALRLRRLLTRR